MKEVLVSEKELLDQFVLATQTKDLGKLNALLHDEGEFTVQREELETFIVSKEEFLVWYFDKLVQVSITDVDYDQCIHCVVGAPVILFNKGMFPRSIKDISERSKTGLAFEFKDNKIHDISFCYALLKTDNPYKFEVDIDEMRRNGDFDWMDEIDG